LGRPKKIDPLTAQKIKNMWHLEVIQKSVHRVNRSWQFGKEAKEQNSIVPTWEYGPANVYLRIGQCGLGNFANKKT
jgi:hypothetical protein